MIVKNNVIENEARKHINYVITVKTYYDKELIKSIDYNLCCGNDLTINTGKISVEVL